MSGGDRLLLLLRHARAVATPAGTSEASDHARALCERGRADAIAMGVLLRDRHLVPDRALVSTAVRARETFALLEAGGSAPELSDGLYLAEPRTLLEALRDDGLQARSLMLIGHNPGMHELALTLAEGSPAAEAGPIRELRANFPTCTLAVFTVAGGWPELAAKRCTLAALLRP